MSNMQVTYADMTDAAARLRQGRDEMEGKLQELGSLIHGLTEGGFKTDQASGAYLDHFTQFQTGTKTAIDGLEGLAHFLEAAAQSIGDTDTQLASQIKA
jgi:WXG100 family type VII secretion target